MVMEVAGDSGAFSVDRSKRPKPETAHQPVQPFVFSFHLPAVDNRIDTRGERLDSRDYRIVDHRIGRERDGALMKRDAYIIREALEETVFTVYGGAVAIRSPENRGAAPEAVGERAMRVKRWERRQRGGGGSHPQLAIFSRCYHPGLEW